MISDGWLIGYNGTATEVIVPKGVTGLSHTAFNTKAMTKIEFEQGSLITQIGDGANTVVPDPLSASKLSFALPIKDGITIKTLSFWATGEIIIIDPNMNTVYETDTFNLADGKKKIIAPLNSTGQAFATKNGIAFEEYVFEIFDGWLIGYLGTATEVIVPNEVTRLSHTVFNTKAMTKIEFEQGSLITQIGDGANPVVPNPLLASKLSLILPTKEGITIKALSFWASGEIIITDPNKNTVYEADTFYLADGKKKIIAPLNSTGQAFATANGIAFEEYDAHSDNVDMDVINPGESVSSFIDKYNATVAIDNTVSKDKNAFKITYNVDGTAWSYVIISASESAQTATAYEGIAYWINTLDKDVSAELSLFDSDGEMFRYDVSKPFYLMSEAKELTKKSAMQVIPKNFKGYVLYPYTSLKKDTAQDLSVNNIIDKIVSVQFEFRGVKGEVYIDDIGVIASLNAFASSHSNTPLPIEEPVENNNPEQESGQENSNMTVGNSGANVDYLLNTVNFIASVAKDVSPDGLAYKFDAIRTNPDGNVATYEIKMPLKSDAFANAQGIVFWIKNFNNKMIQYINIVDSTSVDGVDLFYNMNAAEYYFYIENGVEKAGKGNVNVPANYEGFVLIPYKSFNYYYASDDVNATNFPDRKGTNPTTIDRASVMIYPDFTPIEGQSLYIDDFGVYHSKVDFMASHATGSDEKTDEGPLYVVNDCEDLANIVWSTNVKITVTNENAKEGNNYKIIPGVNSPGTYSCFQPTVIIPDEETHKTIKGIAYWVTGFKGKTNSLMQGPEQVIDGLTETFTYDVTKTIYYIDKDGNLFEKTGNEVIFEGFTGYIIYPYDSFRFYYDSTGVSTGVRKLTKISKLSFGIYATPDNVAGAEFFVDSISYFTNLDDVLAKYVKATSSFEQPAGEENKGMTVGNSGADLSSISYTDNAKVSISNLSPDGKAFRYDFFRTSETSPWFASSINWVNKSTDWKKGAGLCFWYQPTTKILADLSVTIKDCSEAIPEIFNPYNKPFYYIGVDGVRIESQGGVAAPQGFKGWILIPFDSFEFFYKIGEGSSNCTFDQIDSIELYMPGFEQLVGDYMVLDDFSVYNSLDEITKLLAPVGIVNIDKSAVDVELDISLTTRTAPKLTDFNKDLKMMPFKSGDIRTTSAILRWESKKDVKIYKISVYEKDGNIYKFLKIAVAKSQAGIAKVLNLKKEQDYLVQVNACDPWGELLEDGYYEPVSFKTLSTDTFVYGVAKNDSSIFVVMIIIGGLVVLVLLFGIWFFKFRKKN